MFTPDIPTANMSLGTSRTKILNNFTALNRTISKNHFGPDTSNEGKHIYINLPIMTADFPTNPAGQLSLYTKDVGGRSTLFYKKDNSINQWQLTGIDPLASNNGYTFLPGGILIQWGSSALTESNGVSQNISFPTSFDSSFDPLVVVCAKKNAGDSNSDSNVDFLELISSGSNYTGFKCSRSGETCKRINWYAIGPKA